MIGCRGEVAFLDALEIREIAERPEHTVMNESRAAGPIGLLRYGAGVLDGDRTERNLHEALDSWLQSVPVSRRVCEPCPRSGDDTDVWVFEKAGATMPEAQYVCEICGCEWKELQSA